MEPNKQQSTQAPDEISYVVMPQKNLNYEHAEQPPKSTQPPSGPKAPMPHQTDGASNKRMIYLIAGIVILVVIAGIVYYVLSSKNSGSGEKKDQAQASKLPKTWLVKYFNVETCEDQNYCGDDADPDKDGLSNYDEFKKTRTSLNTTDTDSDGLSDGDEYNIYKTEPTDKFTDRRSVALENNYTDGHQIKNGFDPLTPGLKFTETRLKQIAEDTAKYSLHEPTITTLKATQ